MFYSLTAGMMPCIYIHLSIDWVFIPSSEAHPQNTHLSRVSHLPPPNYQTSIDAWGPILSNAQRPRSNSPKSETIWDPKPRAHFLLVWSFPRAP